MLEGIINLPRDTDPEIEAEKASDNRYQLILLNKQGSTYTVLAVPFGTSLRENIEVPSAVYFRASPDEINYKTIDDPTIKLIKHKKGYKYPLVEVDNNRKIIPYRTYEEFPIAYTDNVFYSYLQRQTEVVVGRLEDFIGEALNKDKKVIEKFFNVLEVINKFNIEAYDIFNQAFYDKENPSIKMNFLERKREHWHLKNLNFEEFPDFNNDKKNALKFFLGTALKELFKKPVVQALSPSYIKRNVLFRKVIINETKRKRMMEQMSAIRELYPGLFRDLKKTNKIADNNYSKSFRNLTIGAGIGTAIFYSFPIGLGIASYGILDRFFAKRNHDNKGAYTGLVGQIKDFLVPENLRDFYVFNTKERGKLI